MSEPATPRAPRGAINLWLAILLLASASAVVRKLVEIGMAHPIHGRNPISFCNVLFAGNLVALVALLALHRRDWTRETIARIKPGEWAGLIGVSLLSVAAAPALTFTALELTSVTSVVLLGRIEPPLVLALAAFVLRERLDRWGVIGAMVAIAGVVCSLVLQPGGVQLELGKGELLAMIGACCLAGGTIIAKGSLRDVPLGFFAGFRTAVGTVVFAITVMVLYGAEHFAELISPVLWGWMLIYGVVIVAGGQLLWFSGLRHSSTVDVTLASSVAPLIAIAAAFLLLGEVPTQAQWIGGGVILVGIAIGAAGALRKAPAVSEPAEKTEGGVGFKGI